MSQLAEPYRMSLQAVYKHLRASRSGRTRRILALTAGQLVSQMLCSLKSEACRATVR